MILVTDQLPEPADFDFFFFTFVLRFMMIKLLLHLPAQIGKHLDQVGDEFAIA